MKAPLRTLRLAAVNIDGVLLNDTFSPVLHRLVVEWGGTYTAELERRMLSQPQSAVARLLVETTGVNATVQEVIQAYFAVRERYLREHPVRLLPGALALLERLAALGLDLVCYGGLEADHFHRHLGAETARFTAPGYICTNDCRPGIREIVEDSFSLRHDQVLFIDDAASFAVRARELDVPFIGHPSHYENSFQPELMREAGARHVAGSLDEIDEALVRRLDQEAGDGTVWRNAGRPAAQEVGR
ncbi:HAD family phosphatase [Streptomyces sp. DT20]|uniref:haloacid dehalogenase-like hydrolase n=1 Tax=unclassified Streptomyces TaxID=2593676 RepID=UPI00093FCEF9|nr:MULTISPECIES: haloacid dehalogenase-like hydrolase [unclassified Streptomyces]OKK13232.1 haloacid dehalogenase-like hydrolase [Streptomyces sp. CB02488]WNI34578.1 HAD family phosphatase [Streptomyces sp. ITFR-6]WRZ16862.1 HAD family phosphatase [Streptomyces sp. NBC_00341]